MKGVFVSFVSLAVVVLLLATSSLVSAAQCKSDSETASGMTEYIIGDGSSCLLHCEVCSHPGVVPQVKWYRATPDTASKSNSDKINIDVEDRRWNITYQAPACEEKSSTPDFYDCSLFIPTCSLPYRGAYLCEVKVGTDTTKDIRVDLITTLDDQPIENRKCPDALNLRVEHYENFDNDMITANFSWDVGEPEEDTSCRVDALEWDVQVRSYTNVRNTPADFEVVADGAFKANLGTATSWVRAVGTYHLFTELDEKTYYLFQVRQAPKNISNSIETFASYIYYFGFQSRAVAVIENGVEEITIKQGRSLKISCSASGVPSPAMQWSDVLLQQFQQNSELTTAESIILVDDRDVGSHYCYVSNQLVNPPRGKREVINFDKIELLVDNGTSDLCAPYGGSNSDHCTSRLGNSLPVFTSEDISNEGFGEYFNSVHLPTTKCREIVLSIMCHSFFPYCDPSSTVPRPRPICKESCDAFYSEHCSDSITPIVTPKIYSFINSSCNHSYGDTHKEAGDAPECFVVPLIGHADIVEETGMCATGDGRGYRGNVAVTSSGRTCQRWSQQRPHRHPTDPNTFPTDLADNGNLCRNPGGLGTGPWCYTEDPDVRWEYCTVPRCEVCEPYNGSFCSSIPGFTNSIYVDKLISVEGQDGIEKQISEFYNSFTKDDSITTPGCLNLLRSYLCYGSMPFCSGMGTDPVPQALCSGYCSLLSDMDFCPALRGKVEQFALRTEPNCTAYDGEECISVAISESQYSDTFNLTCYSGYGSNYKGNVSVSLTNDSCLRWDSLDHTFNSPEVHPELQGAENYCRNPGMIGERPWCYTAEGWDYCNITHCDDVDEGSEPTEPSSGVGPTTVIAICISIISTLCVLIVVVTLLVIYCAYANKNKSKSFNLDIIRLARLNNSDSEISKNLVCNRNYVTTGMPSKLEATVSSFPKIDKSRVKYVKEIGRGNFGIVFQGKAVLTEGEEEQLVAVKTLKDDSSEALADFVKEAKLMFSLDHPNILKIHAVAMSDLPYYMITEYMDQGDLAQYLRGNAGSALKRYMNPLGSHRERTESSISHEPPSLSKSELLDICLQVASGMEYLSLKNHVHRDLACRNCLVRKGLTVKICDFGMGHNLYSQNYYRVNGQAVLPIRWMSPEAVVYGRFSIEGDVWSFGILMWEVFSFAIQPYYGISNEVVAERIRRGNVLDKPWNCPDNVYQVMQECWSMEAKERPTFSELIQFLKDCHLSTSSADEMYLSSDFLEAGDDGSSLGSDNCFQSDDPDLELEETV